MQPARALHLSPCDLHLSQGGSVQLLGRPEKLNESFRDLPGYGGLAVVWVQLAYEGEVPCCPGFGGNVVEVAPSDLGSEVALRVYRRRDGRGFPHGSFYNFVVADSSRLPLGFGEWFVEANDADPVCLDIIRGEWVLRKPVAGGIHVHAALQAPFVRSCPHPPLSDEQQRILDSPKLAAERGVVRVLAAAGSGKTTTLHAIAEASKGHTVYAVFNKGMQSEAERKFGGTFADCRTWDSLARAYVQRHFNNGLSFETVDNREETLWGKSRLVWRVVQKFCQSADSTVSAEHVRRVEDGVNVFVEGDRLLSEAEVAALAQAMYDEAANCSGRPDHGVVLKMCQLDMLRTGRRLSRPAACRLLCDEFQDINPVQADVAKMEARSCLVVAVGDPGQSIYKFRGACRALQDLRHVALATFELSGSFRFGSRIAAVANVAQSLHADDSLDDYEVLACRGMAAEAGSLIEGMHPDPTSPSYTVICKTNRQAITLAMELLRRDPQRRPVLLGEPLQQELKLCRALQQLHAFGLPFAHQAYEIDSMEEAARTGRMLKECFHDFQLDRACQIWSQFRGDLVRLQDAPSSSASRRPEALFCTVHQAKGLEWDTVVLGHGCNVTWEKEIGLWQLSHDSVNSLYVAVTRAMRKLYVPEEVMHLLMRRTPCPQAILTGEIWRLMKLGTHQLFHLVPESQVQRVREKGLQPNNDDDFVRLSGSRSRRPGGEPGRLWSPPYVVEVDLDILSAPGARFSAGGGDHPLDQLGKMDPSTPAELQVLVPSVPPQYVRRTYPLHPDGNWQSRHGGMSSEQWFQSFGSDREERAARILAGARAAGRGARGDAWGIAPAGPGVYMVPSQSQAGRSYRVDLTRPTCECPDFKQHGWGCKHILAAKAQHGRGGI